MVSSSSKPPLPSTTPAPPARLMGSGRRRGELADAQRRTEESMRKLLNVVGDMKDLHLELKYARRAGAYFGRFLRKVRVADMSDLRDLLEDRVSPAEVEDAALLDLVGTGRPKDGVGPEEIWLAIGVSSVVDRHDVRRLADRAAILRKAGLPAMPVAAGETATDDAEVEAGTRKVALLADGKGEFWERAREHLA